MNRAVLRNRHPPLPAAILSLILLLLLTAGPGPYAHGVHEPDPVEVSGEVLDLECYVVHQAQGRDNDLCAGRHDDTERPMALLADDGRLFILHAGHRSVFALEKARTVNGRQATITGVLDESNDVLLLEVREIKLREASP
jgi:hypothetical protein